MHSAVYNSARTQLLLQPIPSEVLLFQHLIASDMIGCEVTLSLPASKKRIAGLPLASLCYIPRYDKWYNDLTEKNRRVVDHGQDIRLVALLRFPG